MSDLNDISHTQDQVADRLGQVSATKTTISVVRVKSVYNTYYNYSNINKTKNYYYLMSQTGINANRTVVKLFIEVSGFPLLLTTFEKLREIIDLITTYYIIMMWV